MTKKKTEDCENGISFEHSFEELQEIISKLEDGKLTLSDSLKNYELGIRRLKECHRALNQAENRIRILTKLDADGNLDMSEFDIDNTDESTATPTPRATKKRSRKQPEDNDGLFR